MVDRLRPNPPRCPDPEMPEWEREVAEASQLVVLPGDRVRFNRGTLFAELPELERFYLDGLMEPPDELPEPLPEPDEDDQEGQAELTRLKAELAERLQASGLPDLIAIVGRHRLGSDNWVKLRHPRSGFECQLHQENGLLWVTMLDDREEPEEVPATARDAEPHTEVWRRRTRFVEQPDGTFLHADTKVLVERDPEHPEPAVSNSVPATRLELISVLGLLAESSTVYRDPHS